MPMFQARVKHAESQIFNALDAIEIGDFDGIFHNGLHWIWS